MTDLCFIFYVFTFYTKIIFSFFVFEVPCRGRGILSYMVEKYFIVIHMYLTLPNLLFDMSHDYINFKLIILQFL